MFIAALFTIAKIWKQPKCPSVDNTRWVDKKALVQLHNEILLSPKKGGNLTFSYSMDGPGDYYAKWNKPARERQKPYDLSCMWNLMNKIN